MAATFTVRPTHRARVHTCAHDILSSMKQVITANLNLHTDAHQVQALRRAQPAYRDALNQVFHDACADVKMSNQQALRHVCYAERVAAFGLPAHVACNVPRQVGLTYPTFQTLWT